MLFIFVFIFLCKQQITPFYVHTFLSISYLFGLNVILSSHLSSSLSFHSLPLSFPTDEIISKAFVKSVRLDLVEQFKSICTTLYSHEKFIFSLVTIRSFRFVPRCKGLSNIYLNYTHIKSLSVTIFNYCMPFNLSFMVQQYTYVNLSKILQTMLNLLHI